MEKRKAIYQQFVSSGNWLSKELSGLAQRKKLINEDDSSCPLCEQNLSASRRKFLKLNFEQQESFLAHRLQRLKRIIPLIKEKLITEHAHLVSNKELASQAATLTTKIKELHATHAQLLTQHAHITDTHNQQRNALATQAAALAIQHNEMAHYTTRAIPINNATYTDLLAQKKSVELTLQQHAYKEDAYTQNQERLKAIESQLAAYEAVQKDIAQQENRKNDIRALCSSLKQSAQEIQAIAHKKTALGDLEAQLRTMQEKEKNLAAQGTTLKKQKELLLQKKGSIENQCTRLEKVKQEFDQEKITIGTHQTITDDYHTIATATGKDGIQALLIEEAIPEIEQEANYLLSRLTNNQAQIFIESLRDLKKGGTKETLDIKISDQVGIRPYELFSGGEAFRIDFALRIAISKLLARRAGTALQLLIIDEGFGSQDDEGLGYIMDALHKIQDDFCKIIIVSHLPSMKDQFPVQFFIEKGVQGSTVTIIEQG